MLETSNWLVMIYIYIVVHQNAERDPQCMDALPLATKKSGLSPESRLQGETGDDDDDDDDDDDSRRFETETRDSRHEKRETRDERNTRTRNESNETDERKKQNLVGNLDSKLELSALQWSMGGAWRLRALWTMGQSMKMDNI